MPIYPQEPVPIAAPGDESSSVVSVQGVSGGVEIPTVPSPTSIGQGIQSYLNDYGNEIPISGTVSTYPQQGSTVTNSNFTSTTSATLVSAVASREVLTVYNEGAGTLFINVGSSASITSYQVRLLPGDYWEAPAGQQSLQHSGIFGSAGTARVTQIS